ncbi:TPA: hypothetical protein I4E15_03490 [Enterobacter asburiae]|nr:hypothetical protein [Enterobacter asburiae]HAS1953839.1 hypothetical protein [Enterobacter asburiae]HAS1963605.1 hypothetical protein [Enterobacter asburiae]
MRRVCGMDVQCHLMNLYAIKMIKYYFYDKKKRITRKLPALINHVYALLAGWRCAYSAYDLRSNASALRSIRRIISVNRPLTTR